MPPVPIPPWNAEGLLPPVDVLDPTSANRSPYRVDLSDMILRFATSPERIAILDGLLRYRNEMHAIGLTEGFQWVNGSFTESIETGPKNRAPGDIDVVTFFKIPAGRSQQDILNSNPSLFPSTPAEHHSLKVSYKVDVSLVHLGGSSDYLINRGAYWYGVWAHQRDTYKWKGFLEIDLDPTEDIPARGFLNPALTGATP